jgi:hypothetical protein
MAFPLILHAIVPAIVQAVETAIPGKGKGALKAQIAQAQTEKLLDSVYDGAKVLFPVLASAPVEFMAKEEVIPFIPDVINGAVELMNHFGWAAPLVDEALTLLPQEQPAEPAPAAEPTPAPEPPQA